MQPAVSKCFITNFRQFDSPLFGQIDACSATQATQGLVTDQGEASRHSLVPSRRFLPVIEYPICNIPSTCFDGPWPTPTPPTELWNSNKESNASSILGVVGWNAWAWKLESMTLLHTNFLEAEAYMWTIPEFKDSDLALLIRKAHLAHHYNWTGLIRFRMEFLVYKGRIFMIWYFHKVPLTNLQILRAIRVLIMFGLHWHSSLLVLCSTLVAISYANLIFNLMQDNITVLAPGQAGYSASSTACKSFYVIQPWCRFKLFMILQIICVLPFSLQQLHFQTPHRMCPPSCRSRKSVIIQSSLVAEGCAFLLFNTSHISDGRDL